MKDELLFCPLGGSGEIGMNMNLFAYGKPGEHNTEIHAILAEYGLPLEFPHDVEEFANNIDTSI